MQVESYLGAVFILGTALFFGLMIYGAVKNFEGELAAMEGNRAKLNIISHAERELIDEWVKRNNIQIPQGKGYRYLIIKYKDRPWL